MPSFGPRSKAQLATCDPRLVRLFERVIEIVDCAVIEGARGKIAQAEAVAQGRSKAPWPESKHNVPIKISGRSPAEWPEDPAGLSRAADVAPYPIDWNNRRRFDHFAGVVRGVAAELKIPIRWGGDGSRDFDPTNETFHDLPHFELDD